MHMSEAVLEENFFKGTRFFFLNLLLIKAYLQVQLPAAERKAVGPGCL